MASTGEEHGMFWNSENGDRTYDANSFEYWLKKFFTSGVFNGDLQVEATSGMTLKVGSGYANVDGKVKFWNAEFNVVLDAANSTYPRIDTVVITRDNVNRTITCEKVTGAYSVDSPQPTAPVRDSEIWQIVLAQIYVPAGATGITQSNITDTRQDPNLCGYIAGTVTEMDFSQFTAQFRAYYNEFIQESGQEYDEWKEARNEAHEQWEENFQNDTQVWRQGVEADQEAWEDDFETDSSTWQANFQTALLNWYSQMQGQISTDAAVNLQNQINSLKYFYVQDGVLYVPGGKKK